MDAVQIQPTLHADQQSEFSKNHQNIDLIYLLFSSVWGGTAGALLGYSLYERGALQIGFAATLLSISWLIFPFKLGKGTVSTEVTKYDRVKLVARQEFGKVVSFLTPILLYPLIDENVDSLTNTTRVCLEISLVALNVLFCYGLRTHNPFSNQALLISSAKSVVNGVGHIGSEVFTVFMKVDQLMTRSSTGELDRIKNQTDLKKVIEDLKKKNLIMQAQLKQINQFIMCDPDLSQLFIKCAKQTESILLPPPTMNQSPPVDDPLAEELRQELHKAAYLNDKKTNMFDFLDKNPEFSRQLQIRVSQNHPFFEKDGRLKIKER